jgi:hypothetical protein
MTFCIRRQSPQSSQRSWDGSRIQIGRRGHRSNRIVIQSNGIWRLGNIRTTDSPSLPNSEMLTENRPLRRIHPFWLHLPHLGGRFGARG